MIMILDVDVTAEGGIIKLIARRAIPPPFEPFEPFEPSEPCEPSHRRRVQNPFPLTIPSSLYTLVNKTISEKRKRCFPYFKYKEELCIKFRKRLTNV